MSEGHIQKAFERAAGRWRGILMAAGIESRHLSRRPGPCPMCGGEDRFVFDNRLGRGDYICRQCGAGDGIMLLRKYRGWSFREAFQHIEKMAGTDTAEPACQGVPWKKPRETTPREFWAMAHLWKRADTTTDGDPVAKYLAWRAIGLSARVINLRTLSSLDGKRHEMLARVQDVDGRPVQLHRTLIYAQDLEEGSPILRKLMPGTHPPGSAVRLYEGAKVLGIAEGIESALSAANLYQMPVWAALTAGRLAKFEPPSYVEELQVFGDLDASGAGQNAVRALSDRMEARGVRVRVHVPPAVGVDWNDLLREVMAGAGQHPPQ